jgi:hypothetical protein
MRTTLLATLITFTLATAGAAWAQQPPAGHQHDSAQAQAPAQTQPPAQPGPGGPRGGMHGGGMHGGGMMQGGGMHGGMHQGGMHGGMHGGMQADGMCGMMMGLPMMSASTDPRTLGRMMLLRGEMMKAVGEVLIKHGQTLAATPAK